VAALHLGFGLVEMAGGFAASSQALKADALGSLADGLLAALALLGARRGPAWRARAARAAGLVLGALALGVLVAAAHTAAVPVRPDPQLMGLLGAWALAVGAAGAFLLLPHRPGGDAEARAAWLCGGRDALGNLAVLAAAGLVAWTGAAWPDAAAAVAVLALRSWWPTVRAARAGAPIGA
jgi:Co/Zn/Cd efflux system component